MTYDEQLAYDAECLKNVLAEGPAALSYWENVFYMTGLIRGRMEKQHPDWLIPAGSSKHKMVNAC